MLKMRLMCFSTALTEMPSWIAMELTEAARPYCEALKKLGVLCKETHDHVIRIAPPLTIIREEILWAFDRIKMVIENPK